MPLLDVLLAASLCAVVVANTGGGVLSGAELDLFKSQFGKVRADEKYIHMVEFGGGFETSELSQHDAIVSWNVVSHDQESVQSMQQEFQESSRISLKYIPADFSIWDQKLKDPANEEGTIADFEAYVNEILFFGAKDKAAYWVFNFGKARVDVGIVALPLLVRTGGLMIIPGWTTEECYSESLSQFYDVVELVGSLAVLRPKDTASLLKVAKSGVYDWCFSFVKGGKVLRQKNGPSAPAGVIETLRDENIGCADIGGDNFYCDENESTCASCYGVMTAISDRGFQLKKSLKKVRKISLEDEEL
jgi:hypothetical protein